MDKRIIDITNCARCGRNHDKVEFIQLFRPIDECTHWAMCPYNEEPILLEIRNKNVANKVESRKLDLKIDWGKIEAAQTPVNEQSKNALFSNKAQQMIKKHIESIELDNGDGLEVTFAYPEAMKEHAIAFLKDCIEKGRIKVYHSKTELEDLYKQFNEEK